MWRALAIAGCAAMALAGCGTQHAAQGAGARTTAPAPSPAQRAAADAANLLAAFPAPPGAVRTGPLPVPWLARAPQQPNTPDLAARTGWWRVAGQPQSVLAWVRAHMPSGIWFAGTGAAGQGPRIVFEPAWPHPGPGGGYIRMWYAQFYKPAVPEVLAARRLFVSVAGDGTGQVAIRVDAEVVWVPGKSAAERIPAAAKVVTIAPVPGEGGGPVSASGQPVTITDPAKVARIAAVVDALPVFPVGRMSCPLLRAEAMQLTFKATPTGSALAVVTGDTTGCGTVAVSVHGQPMRTLGQARSMQQQVMTIAGLHWPGFPAA